MTMEIQTLEFEHVNFFDDSDHVQRAYEQLRLATLDRRHFSDSWLRHKVETHGVAGLFIDPERTVVAHHQPQRHRTSVRSGTALHRTHLREQEFETIATSLAEGVGIRTTCRIQRVNEKTVLHVLDRAGNHARKVSRSILLDARVNECQLDEMWSFVGKKEKNLDILERMSSTLGDAWIWIAFDAVNKIVLAHVVGKRTLPHAIKLLQEVKRVTADMPALFASDQLDQYQKAILHVYGIWEQPCRKGKVGRMPNPRLVPPENLVYVQVVKKYEKSRISDVSRKIVFGTPEQVERILADSAASKKINTSHIERNNGTVRHIDSRCVRKTYRFSKIMKNHKLQLQLSMAYYHLCRPHRTLTKRHGKPTTPFMAAGFTDHIWTMRELLKFRPRIHGS